LKNTEWQKSRYKINPDFQRIRSCIKIYLRRIERWENGNAIDDWRKAEELLKGS